MALKVLVLEDDPAKKVRLLKFLGETPELFDQIDIALCTENAERFLKERVYDLFVVDIVVPSSHGGEKHERNSIALLQRLEEGVTSANMPRYVLPVSSSSELSKLAHDYFLGRPWGILPYNDASEDTLRSIERIAKFISSHANANTSINCDVLIITALLDPEFAAIERLPFEWDAYEPLDDQHLMKRGSFQTAGKRREVVAVCCSRMGPVQAAILIAKCLGRMSPKSVIMAGICAGVPKKADIGDVVAAELSWDWQSGKFVDSKGVEAFEIAPHQLDMNESLRSGLIMLKKDVDFWSSFSKKVIELKVDIPKLVIGPMATGSSVLADERVMDRIKLQQHKNVVGLDMETYGVYAAVQACNPNLPVLSLKAVCDKGDIKKNDKYQPYAAMISASAVHHYLTNYWPY